MKMKRRMTEEEVQAIAEFLQGVISVILLAAVTGFVLWASLQH
jgi:hypothetical protein